MRLLWRGLAAAGLIAVCAGGIWASQVQPASAAAWSVSKVVSGLTGAGVAQVDGRRILFTSGTAQARDVWLYEMGAATARKLDERPFADPLHCTPQMNAGYVVYAAAAVGQDYNIYLYDMLTGSTKSLTTDTKGNFEPRISGDYVAYVSGQGAGAGLMLYQISTGKKSAVTIKDVSWDGVSGLSLDGGYLTWTAAHAAGAGARDSDVFVYDISRQQTVRIYSDLLDGTAQVSADRVIWQNSDSAGSVSSVRMYEPTAGGRITVLSGDEPVAFLEAGAPGTFVDASHVAWLSRPDGDLGGLVRLHGFADGLDKVLGSSAFCRNPQVGGTAVAWTGSNDGADWGDVFAYDIPSTVTSQLTGQAVGDRPPKDGESGPVVVAGAGNVAWVGAGRESLFLASSSALPSAAQPFADVTGASPYQIAVDALFWRGIVSGHRFSNGQRFFDPAEPVNRAQFAKMIVGTLGVPIEPEGARVPFTDLGADVADDAYPHEYVATVWKFGITQGISASSYGPWRSIKRAQVVTMLVRAAENLSPGVLKPIPAGYVGSLPGYTSPDHAANLKLAEFNGLLDHLQGFGSGWDPEAPADRAEVAQLMWNYLQLP